MNTSTLILKYLIRNKSRSCFTVLTILVAFLLYGMLGALNSAYVGGVKYAGAENLITLHKKSMINPLPITHLEKMQRLEGVNLVSYFNFFGAYYQTPKQSFFAAATDPAKLLSIYPEFKLSVDEQKKWQSTQTGVIVGRALADMYGFEVGDLVQIGSSIWPKKDNSRSWEFTIEGIFLSERDASKEMALYLNFDYFNRSRLFGENGVGWFVTRIDNADLSESIIEIIDTTFDDTKTASEKSWAKNFYDQFGNITLMVFSVITAVFFIMLMVVSTTMFQSISERTNQFAVLRTLGFSQIKLLSIILAECLCISVIGGSLGLASSIPLIMAIKPYVATFIPGFAIHNDVYVYGFGMAVFLGLLAGAIPALKVLRLKVAKSLRVS